METLGKKIRKIRDDNGMKQIEFATMLDIDRSYLSKIESDKMIPGRDLLIKISNEFNIPIDWLIDNTSSSHTIFTKNQKEVMLLQAFRQLPENEAKIHLKLILQRLNVDICNFSC